MRRTNFSGIFEIQMYYVMLTRRPDLVIVNNNNSNKKEDFAVPPNHWVKLNDGEKKDKYLDLARELKKTNKQTMEHESGSDTTCNRRARYNHERISTRTGGLGNKRTSGDYQTTTLLRSARILRRVMET